MKRFITSALILLVGCAAGHHVMTMDEFHDVPVGTTVLQLTTTAGKPYSISRPESGVEEYKYIERLTIGKRVATERHYFFLLKEGKVIGKRIEDISPPPYMYNSYDLQTSSNDDNGSDQED